MFYFLTAEKQTETVWEIAAFLVSSSLMLVLQISLDDLSLELQSAGNFTHEMQVRMIQDVSCSLLILKIVIARRRLF